MPQPLLPMFPADVTEINDLVSFAKREGTVYCFHGPMPVFSHAESDRASFRMFTSQMVINGNCTQAQLVRAFGISVISMKRYVKQYRQSGAAGFFKVRAARQPRVLTPAVRQEAQELPEVHTLRTKLGLMAQGQKVESWSASLSQQWMEPAPELAGRRYLDGHVRGYHGHQTPLPKRYVAREKLCLRGTTDYWINDRDGRPFFVVNTAANPGLIAVLRQEIIPRLLKEVPHQPPEEELKADPDRFRFVMIFDREGYSPELFAELWRQRIAAQTYRKGSLEDWPMAEFQEYEAGLPNGEKQRMKLAERGVWLGDKLWVREIRQLASDGHQTAVISTDFKSDLVQIARQMFSRWAQENWFKYMIEHFGLESLVTYQLEPVSETTRVVNPAARTLGTQIKSKAAQLSRRRAE